MAEIESDGFITRSEDLSVGRKKVDEDRSQAVYEIYDKVVPPIYGTVYENKHGAVIMCKGTYKQLLKGQNK